MMKLQVKEPTFGKMETLTQEILLKHNFMEKENILGKMVENILETM